jgi:hypothetical protein
MPSQRSPSQSEQDVTVDRHVDGGVQYVVKGPRLGLVVKGIANRPASFFSDGFVPRGC